MIENRLDKIKLRSRYLNWKAMHLERRYERLRGFVLTMANCCCVTPVVINVCEHCMVRDRWTCQTVYLQVICMKVLAQAAAFV